jgi:P27 family predicted phage terminase small subunit
MPRTKKPAGTTVDKRNGRQVDLVLAATSIVRPDLPADLCAEAVEQWDAFWADSASSVQTSADRGVLLRWIDAINRYLRTIGEADQQPLVEGSTGQLVENPLYKIADRALGTIERCEKQLGIGALNRAGLGIAVMSGQRSLADMNARYGGGDNDPATGQIETDPRLGILDGEVV